MTISLKFVLNGPVNNKMIYFPYWLIMAMIEYYNRILCETLIVQIFVMLIDLSFEALDNDSIDIFYVVEFNTNYHILGCLTRRLPDDNNEYQWFD